MTSALSGARAFRHRDFIRYWSSRFVSANATQIQGVAVGWVYDLTRDPLALGLMGLALFLPAMGLALLAGQVADCYDRRTILLICYAIATLATAGLLGCAWRPRVAFRHEPGASSPPGSASRRRHLAGTPP